jgi:hypothetical protein
MRRLDCHDRMRRVKRDYSTVLQTVRALIRLVEQNHKYIKIYNLDINEMRAVGGQLHDIYFTRMFASFESSLRHFWRRTVKDTQPGTKQLISLIAARRAVPEDTLNTVQEIRAFRNILMHEEDEVRCRFQIDEAIGPLNTYLASLPLEWQDSLKKPTRKKRPG